MDASQQHQQSLQPGGPPSSLWWALLATWHPLGCPEGQGSPVRSQEPSRIFTTQLLLGFWFSAREVPDSHLPAGLLQVFVSENRRALVVE